MICIIDLHTLNMSNYQTLPPLLLFKENQVVGNKSTEKGPKEVKNVINNCPFMVII